MPFRNRDGDPCVVIIEWSRESLADIRKNLDFNNVTRTGCKVRKHPDCCHLCVLNNDCSKLPVHVNCRCRPEPVLYIGDDEE